MAGDSQNMERSTLERKDRAELAAVAGALGLKVPSRAKKADIVTLILDVVAQPSDDGAPAGGSGASSADDGAPVVAEGSAPAAGDDARDGDARDDAASDDAAHDTDEPSPAAPATGDDHRDHGDRAPQGGSDDDSHDDDHHGDHADGDADGNAEGGGRNRRRRRRGRDRADGEAGGAGQEFEAEPVEVSGLLDLRDDGYGFLRVAGFLPSRDDVYVSVKQCRQLGLRKGDHLTGLARPAGHKEKNPALTRVETVNGLDPEQARSRARFDDLTPILPDTQLTLDSGDAADLTARIVDRIAPVGKGQRGIVAAPPGSGATSLLTTIAVAIAERHPDVHLIVLLLDERPETVTEVRRALDGADVVASTFDRPVEEHTAVAERTIEHAKRLVEYGNDVVILLDGLTRLARAYNLAAPAGGRVLAGGLDVSALAPTKRFFGAARNTEEGGSLTIVATAAVDTGSALDEVILEEFEGTANMELRLDGSAAAAEIYPPLPVGASRREQEQYLAGLPADGGS
ncbi:MAG: transcription termination factor Rho [Acidimicrobiales bacterium]